MNKELRRFLRTFLPRRVKPHLILRGPLRGMRIVTSWHDYPGAILGRTETGLLSWFEANVRSGETWIDIGAHYGYTALALCKLVGAQGRVHAFEPVLSTVGCLDRTRTINGLSQLSIVPLALDNHPYINMVRMPSIRGMAYQGSGEPDLGKDILTVSFDAIWDHICNGDRGLNGVKIDVQGMEIEVLEGMRQSLRKFRPKLVVELHHGVNRYALLDLVESLGYSSVGFPVEPCSDEDESDPGYYDDRSYAFLSSECSIH